MPKSKRATAAVQTSGIFAKTVMCKFYAMSACRRGTNCHFAHDAAELMQQPDLKKTRMCPDLRKYGSCQNIQDCTYAHRKAELRPVQTRDADSTAVPQNKAPQVMTDLRQTSDCEASSTCSGTRRSSNASDTSPRHLSQGLPFGKARTDFGCRGVHFSVKNTFIHAEEEMMDKEDVFRPLSRSQSSPGRFLADPVLP
eukprot:gb/GFBE01032840.1/.p1 GENE.gb/GFBE01032840.1/~~gb/GFBE01032840.1/.p1  ORF type:complete len:197 (+),score=30.64 gb/GFBE01032840.1/:1-591(+)